MINNETVAYISEKVAEVARKHPYDHISITVIMPELATQAYPTFVVGTYPVNATEGEPTTIVRIR